MPTDYQEDKGKYEFHQRTYITLASAVSIHREYQEIFGNLLH